MAEYIDREAMIEDLQDTFCKGCNSYNGIRCGACHIDDAISAIDSFDAADVAPVVHGRWVIHCDCDGFNDYSTAVVVTTENYDTVRYEHPGYSEPKCEKCKGKALLNGAEEYVLSDYCPNCGAKMDGGR